MLLGLSQEQVMQELWWESPRFCILSLSSYVLSLQCQCRRLHPGASTTFWSTQHTARGSCPALELPTLTSLCLQSLKPQSFRCELSRNAAVGRFGHNLMSTWLSLAQPPPGPVVPAIAKTGVHFLEPIPSADGEEDDQASVSKENAVRAV